MYLIGRIFQGIKDIIIGKQSVDKKKIDKEIASNENQTTIQKMELESDDDFISRTRAFIIRAAFVGLLLDAFGFRVWVLNKLGISAEAVDYDKMLNLFIDIIASALVSS